jgi:IS30 family transposase
MKRKTFKHLSKEERFVIEKLYIAKVKIREMAKFLLRSPNTVSREIFRNSVKGIYTANKAHKWSYFKRYRSKKQCLKVAMDRFICRFVDKKLRDKWSPEQISGYLKKEMNINCSTKCIYKFTRKRSMDRFLFWGWNNVRGGRKKYQYKTQKDGRKYIEDRPPLNTIGHYEMDFIVSKQSNYSFLVVVDRLTRYTMIEKIPNRKRDTINIALSEIFNGNQVLSITTDNDISFSHWKSIENIFNTKIYFTHPYHSWEKGLVENTNRWIRCFVPKIRDIGTVTKEEIYEILSFLNNRPRKCIDFRLPSEYYLE